MKKFKIALVPGDGVGQEVVEAARKVLEAVAQKGEVQFEFTEYMAGKIAYDKTKGSPPARDDGGDASGRRYPHGSHVHGSRSSSQSHGATEKGAGSLCGPPSHSVLSGGVVSER